MVTRLLKYPVDLAANDTDVTVDTKSPGAGKQFGVQEIYVDSEDDVSYSLVYEERKLFDNVPDTALADENNGLPVDLTVAESEDLSVLATEEGGSTSSATVIVRVDETTG